MRHYKNAVTGAEIFTENEIHGENWVEIVTPKVKTETPKDPDTKPVKKTGKRAKK